MEIKRKLRMIADLGIGLTAVSALMLGGCGWMDDGGGGGGGGTAAAPATGGANPVVISGVAVMGRMFGATARAFAVDSKGVRSGSALGSGTTTTTGEFTISADLSSIPTGPVLIEISGGSYISETDGAIIPGPTVGPMTAILSHPGVIGVSGVAVTPLSDISHAHAVAHASLPGASAVALTTAMSNADAFVSKTFGLASSSVASINPEFTAAALAAKSDSGKAAFAIAALDSLAKKLGVGGIPRAEVYAAFSDDWSDGSANGSKFDAAGSSVSVTIKSAGASAVLPATTLGFDLAREFGALRDRITSGSASAVFPGSTLELASAASAVGVLASDMGTSVTSIIPPSVLTATGVSSTSSGAMSYLSTGGHQFLFIAARNKGVRKVDVTDPAAAFELTPPAWNGAALFNDAGFAGNAIGGAMVVSSATGVQVLAFAYGAKQIALLDPDTGNVTYKGNLPLVATSPAGFSGGSAFIAGSIPDPGKGAWLATTDGYIFLDVNATLAAGTGAAPVLGATSFPTKPVGGGLSVPNQLAENLGGDIAHNLLFTPNYGGLSLQVLADQPGVGGLLKGTYQLDPAFATAHSVPTVIMDGGAVDTGLGVGIITYEDTSNASFINLSGITAGVPTTASPLTFLPLASNGFVDVSIGGGTFSGSAVDSRTHQVFGMAGFSTDIFVGQIQDPATVAPGGTWSGMSDWVFATLFNYSSAHDPHANVTLFNDKTGKTFAYLLDGDPSPTGVQQIDVSALLAVPRVSGSHQAATDPQAAGGPITKIPLSL